MRRLDRLDDDHGAVAVMVALLMVVLIGAAAIAVDVGDLYGERRILQNGADAAALAVAQDCAGGSCGDTSGTAAGFIASNDTRGRAGLDDVTFPTGSSVRVTSRSTVPHNFARALGFDQTDVRAAAGAAWGTPSGGPAMIPLAISWCSFDATNFDTVQLVQYHDQHDDVCSGPGGQEIPGGFGWLAGSGCTADVSLGWAPGKTGVSAPGGCTSGYMDQLKNETVLLPIFSDSDGSGEGGWYTIHGFAAFHLTGWRLGNTSLNWNNTTPPSCTGSCRGVKGYFTEFVSLDDAWEFGGPDLGGSVVHLTQ